MAADRNYLGIHFLPGPRMYYAHAHAYAYAPLTRGRSVTVLARVYV